MFRTRPGLVYPRGVRAYVGGILVASLLFPWSASAQEAPPPGQPQPPAGSTPTPENPRATQEAREHFQAGMEHFRAFRYRDAIREWHLAAGLVPSADLWYNIASAHEKLSEYEPAIEHYQRYLHDRVDPPDRAQVEEKIAWLQRRIEEERSTQHRERPTHGTLRIESSVERADVSIDGRPVGAAPIAEPLSLGAGRYRLEVHDDGYVPFRADVRVSAGVTTGAYAGLVPATRYEAVRGGRIFTWIVGGAAIVAFGASGYFALDAASKQADIDNLRAQQDADIAAMGYSDIVIPDADLIGVEDAAFYSDVSLGIGLALAVGAVVLYFLEGQSIETERVRGPRQEASRLRPAAF